MFNTGKKYTDIMKVGNNHLAAKYCGGVEGYYIPSLSELKWIRTKVSPYFGKSYRFNEAEADSDYWTATESSESNSWSVNSKDIDNSNNSNNSVTNHL